MKRPASTDTDIYLVAQIAAAISIAAFFYYLRRGDLLLFGDAVAHINIARRVFDSRTPGPLQLGTVWLPLPHLLMLPFLASRWMWQNGVGGAFPSMLAYVFSVTGIFRLVRSVLPPFADGRGKAVVRFTAWVAAGIFAVNPNIIYMQTTAMTEPVYLPFFIWSIVFFAEALKYCRQVDSAKANSALVRTGLCLAGACLTRYDGWFLAVVIGTIAIVLAFFRPFAPLRLGVVKMVLIAAVAPVLWLAYNAAVYRNPLEFANGPYSARAIEQKTAIPGFPPHPGANNLRTSFHYFFKSAQLNMAGVKTFQREQGVESSILQGLWVFGLIFGTVVVVLFQRKLWPVLLLWVPVPFYMLSIAYSGVPIFIPVWWPFSYYNVRYGVELLPAFAVLTALAVYG
ncbi:MAG TPA: phospholipid carrier-dependent glycosyltransferase, partial [Terriglobales bacterium]